MEYLWIFAAGAAASLHCVGMCGGFALALGAQRGRPVLRQALYNLGRVNTLVLIGGFSGAAGATFISAGPVQLAERSLAVVAGLLMAVIALESLGLGPQFTARGSSWARATVGQALGGVMRSNSLVAPFAFGVFNAFLPCQLIYAFAARAASTASVVEGMLTMLAFGLGTVPAMATVGLARGYVDGRVRAGLSITSAVVVLIFALITIARGFGIDVHSLGHHGHVH